MYNIYKHAFTSTPMLEKLATLLFDIQFDPVDEFLLDFKEIIIYSFIFSALPADHSESKAFIRKHWAMEGEIHLRLDTSRLSGNY